MNFKTNSFDHRTIIIIFISFIIISRVSSRSQHSPSVTISQGTLQGSYNVSRDQRTFKQFRGIKYGKIPRRFDLSVPAGKWDGIRLAINSGPGCINAYSNNLNATGVELDCLDLDISTPWLPKERNFPGPMPVFVWIFGGAFYSGDAKTYGSKYFMDEDVVLVEINFRLGAFGLLNAGIKEARGNQALKDQVLALKWVKNNIANFGGDPNLITIFGESTGGGSVSLLTLSPMAKGLFSRAIMQSGVATVPQLIKHANPGLKNAKMFAEQLNCTTGDLQAMVACLRNIPAKKIAEFSTVPADEFGWIEDGVHLGVTLETFSTGPNDPNVFLSEDPSVIAQRGDFARVPMIIGKIAQEGYISTLASLSDANYVNRLNTEFNCILPGMLIYYNATTDPCTVTAKLHEYYLQGRNVSLADLDAFERLSTDRLMTHPVRKIAEQYAKHTDVFLFNFTRSKANETIPPSHTDDLYYLFNVEPIFPEIKPGDPDYQFSKDFIRAFVTFAKTGKPGRWGSSSTEWTPIIPGQPQKYLQLSDKPFMKVVDKQFSDSWAFWDSLNLSVV